MLLVISYLVEGDVTLQASTTQSHPMEGHSTALTCDVRNMNESQVIIWNKDQRSITWGNTMGQMMSTRFELLMDNRQDDLTTYTLTIHNVTRDDDGLYQCQVLQENGNGYSAMASESVILSVLYFPASDYPDCSLTGRQTLLTGSEFMVSCTSEVGNPQISSAWMAGDPTSPAPSYRMAESPSMVVAELNLQITPELDGAVYMCRVTSPAYPDLNRYCSLGPLRILEWPIVSITRSAPRVAEGADIHFLCTTEPRMPDLQWETYPRIDPDRLVLTDNGSILTVKNVGPEDNTTYVVCQVPYKDTHVEAGSVILIEKSTIDHPWIAPTPPTHATSQLCAPWFGAFVFTAVVNIILCIIITTLLLKVRKLSSKQKTVQSDASSNDGIVWPSTSTNWSMTSEKLLRDKRRQSWKSYQPKHEAEPVKEETTTYMTLRPDNMDEKSKDKKNQPHCSVSLPRHDHLDKPYVTPRCRTQIGRDPAVATKAATQSPVKSSRKTASKTSTPMKTPASKAGNHSKRSAIQSVSKAIPMHLPSPVESSSYMDLNEKTKKSSTPKQTYQALQKNANSSRSTAKPMPTLSITKESGKAGKEEMAYERGIYDGSGLSDSNKYITRQGSMVDESASYMPVGTIKGTYTPQIKRNRSGTTSSKSSTEPYDTPYESNPGSPIYSSGTTDDDMGDGMYRKPSNYVGAGNYLKSGSSRGTISSRAPLPDPSATRPTKQEDADMPSTDESYKEHNYSNKHQKKQVYVTLEPDNYTNYGADVSSECESYQGAEICDWVVSDNTAVSVNKSVPPVRKPSTSSQASYLELGDAEGEIKGYMIMKKGTSNQLKVPPKFTKKAGPATSESECSSNEYYEQMEEGKQQYEYAIPPSNQLPSLKETKESDTIHTVKEKGSSEERIQKKKGRWGLFNK